MSKRVVGEPSPSHGRDSPCSLATGSDLNRVSESYAAAGKLDPSGVGSYAPYIGTVSLWIILAQVEPGVAICNQM